MRLPFALIALSLVASSGAGTAQTPSDREAVRVAVLDYVEGFYQGDTTRLVRSVWPEVRKYGYWREKPDAAYTGEAMPFAEFMAYANGVKNGRHRTPAGAVKEIVVFDVQDQTASAKLTAWWGTDYLLLARERGRWSRARRPSEGPADPRPAPLDHCGKPTAARPAAGSDHLSGGTREDHRRAS